jgi:Uncharacterized conserved protein
MESVDDIGLSDEEPITAQKVLQTLQEVWLNEKFSPELLQHQSDLVDCMLDQIQQMEENLRKLKKNDFRVVIHRMELDRIRYIVADYLRIRLNKIERFVIHVLEQESSRNIEDPYLSPPELKFAREYLSHMEEHLRLVALRHMPTNVQDFEKTKVAVIPNLSSHVFLRAKQSITGVVIVDDENREDEVDLDENSQHIMQYKSVANYLKTGAIQLI